MGASLLAVAKSIYYISELLVNYFKLIKLFPEQVKQNFVNIFFFMKNHIL